MTTVKKQNYTLPATFTVRYALYIPERRKKTKMLCILRKASPNRNIRSNTKPSNKKKVLSPIAVSCWLPQENASSRTLEYRYQQTCEGLLVFPQWEFGQINSNFMVWVSFFSFFLSIPAVSFIQNACFILLCFVFQKLDAPPNIPNKNTLMFNLSLSFPLQLSLHGNLENNHSVYS